MISKRETQGYRSTTQMFWTREDLPSLSAEEKLAYLRLLSTSGIYGLHGLTSISQFNHGKQRRVLEHRITPDIAKVLANHGFIVYDSFHELAFFPGATQDIEANIDSVASLRSNVKILNSLPATSIPVQLWALSWFLSNLGKAKIQVVVDFLEAAFIYMKPLLDGASFDEVPDIDITKTKELTVEISELIYEEIPNPPIFIQNIVWPIISKYSNNRILGFNEYFISRLVGRSFDKRANTFKERRFKFGNSLTRRSVAIFDQLYLAKFGVPYLKTTDIERDMHFLGWMIRDFGKDEVMNRMKMYFNSDDHKFTISDFRSSFKSLIAPEQGDTTEYWKILEGYKKGA
jgi:hypothetical protein